MVDALQIDEIMGKVFPNGIMGKQRLEIKKIKEYMEELDIDPSNSPFETAEEFKAYLLHTRTKGFEVKDLLIKALQDIDADFDESVVRKINTREERCGIFFSVFNIFPNGNDDAWPTRLTREQFAALYSRANKIDAQGDIHIDEIEGDDAIEKSQVYISIADTLSVYSGCVGLLRDSGEVVAVGQLEENQGKLQLILPDVQGDDNAIKNLKNFILAFIPQKAASLLIGNVESQQYNEDVYICHCRIKSAAVQITKKEMANIYERAVKVDKQREMQLPALQHMDDLLKENIEITFLGDDMSVSSACFGVFDDAGDVIATGHLEGEGDKQRLFLHNETIDYESFMQVKSFMLVFFPAEAEILLEKGGNMNLYDGEIYTGRFRLATDSLSEPEITAEQMNSLYAQAVHIDKSDSIDVAEFVFTEKMPVTLQDSFFIKIPNTLSLYMGCVGLINCNTGEVAAIGYLEYNKDVLHLLFKSKNIVYNSFIANRKFKIVLFPQEAASFFQRNIDISNYKGNVYEVECYLDYQKLDTTEKTLCIDFGTSNTTAGSYGIKEPYSNDVELVKFLDITEDAVESKEMLPTIVYVASCADSEHIEYICGYEAKKKIIEADYDTQASVFYEIKRWITDINEKEEIFDENGNKCNVSRKEILRAYIQYVIDKAEQYFKVKFKTLHFSAPVKLKATFNQEMNDLFKGQYTVLREQSSLDEGVAIIYNHIAKRLCENSMSEDEEKIMILDCGGGTTDLARCTYHYVPTASYKIINVVTSFENGDSNFGGNNVTYRILQILKIKLAHYIKSKKEHSHADRNLSVQELIQNDENEIMTRIDGGESKRTIYESFEKAYDEAEQYIPTKFAESKLMKEKRKIKRNYYYLWQMAEAIKIEFYRINLVVLDFNKDKDRKIYAQKNEQYYLFIHDGASNDLIKYDNPMKDIDITINEIRRVLCPDIYALLNTLFGKQNPDELMNCSFYKLSGQSCKISLFHDLFKEFIPGKYLRAAKGVVKENSTDLKLACIKGSIEYIRDKEIGEIKPNISVQVPKLIYDIYRIGSTGEEKVLGADGSCRLIERPDTAKKVDFVVKDSNGVLQKQFTYVLNLSWENKCNKSDIEQCIRETANIEEESLWDQIISTLYGGNEDELIYLFLLPAKQGYGVNIYQINKHKGEFYLQEKGTFESFEGETLETFFNGKR
ncbi:hypothetical protein [Megasphaera stantonii]|uniref:Molecular chaperone n=1 Tax=Megasphaera stantonii TaxID=2144175 RepID=A0A346AXY6_9FIRM|nr:hypothetical protein [Megasphaera stantonii]AXL20729.1 hypothetical protein DKB62_03630 [Megasphaera stantonii]